jgi:hypothetical protein
MNANELINKLKLVRCIAGDGQILNEAETMLRQQQAEIKKWTDQYQRLNENLEMWKAGHFKQQAEIEALKKEAALQRLSDFTQEVEAKYSDAWWKEVVKFNKQLKAQEK